jgi:hypothetical protein
MVLEILLASVLLAQASQGSPPVARRGFQGSLGLQRAEAGGDIVPDLRHRDSLPAATELEAQLGWKLGDRLFAGFYLAGGVTTPDRDTRSVCEDEDLQCAGASRRAGVLVKVDLRPTSAWNPWLGLGSGVEWHDVDWARRAAASASPDAPTVLSRGELDVRGVELARVMAGVDFRSTRTFGIGAHAALSFGRYRDATLTSAGSSTMPAAEHDLAEDARATHTWLTVGVHGVLFP